MAAHPEHEPSWEGPPAQGHSPEGQSGADDPRTEPEAAGGDGDTALREAAARSLRRKRDFWGHLRVYLIVNSLIAVIWVATALSSGVWFFWPVFPLVGWGVGLALHASATFGRAGRPLSEPEISAEMERLSQP